MNRRLLEYYTPRSARHPTGRFHAVIDLETHLKMGWEKLAQICPTLPHGWLELVTLSAGDRIELMREHWLLKIFHHPKIEDAITKFFLSLDYIGVFLTQLTYNSPFEPELVYGVSGQGGFFRGRPGANLDTISMLQKEFVEYILPVDYISFLLIHDGFANWVDIGIFGSRDVALACIDFQELLEKACEKVPYVSVHPKSLIPFYQSSQEPFFQCFWAWHPHPKQENMHFIEDTQTIAVIPVTGTMIETMSFTTFLDWFIFYLEKID